MPAEVDLLHMRIERHGGAIPLGLRSNLTRVNLGTRSGPGSFMRDIAREMN